MIILWHREEKLQGPEGSKEKSSSPFRIEEEGIEEDLAYSEMPQISNTQLLANHFRFAQNIGRMYRPYKYFQAKTIVYVM